MEATDLNGAPAVFLPHDWLRFLPSARGIPTASRLGLPAFLVLFLILHASVIGLLIYRDMGQPSDIPAPPEEIPVEIIVEQPKAEPPPPPPPPPVAKQKVQPPPPPPPEDLRPAYSAPRKAADPEVSVRGIEQKTAAPEPKAKPQEGQPAPAAAPKVESASTAPTVKDVEAKSSDAPDAEAIGKAGPDNPAKPDDKEAQADKKALASVLKQLSTTTLSDFSFAQKTKVAPITGGLEDNRYLANVYAKIMSKKQYPRTAAARRAKGMVTIAFVLDDNGRVVYQATSRSSGEADLDAAAAAAVKLGAPYPPPPFGVPHSLVATIEFDAK
jgi:protein TonB